MRRHWIAAFLVVGLVAQPAAADVLCRGRGGRVALRAACKRREAPLDLPKGPTGDPGPAAVPPVRIVDAAGVSVGVFGEPANEDNVPSVIFDVGGRAVQFYVYATGFSPDGVLNHLVPHCADTPLIQPGTLLVQPGFVVGSTAYYYPETGEPGVVVSQESNRPGMSCGTKETLANGNCCVAFPSFPAIPLGPAVVAFDIPSLGLTPPLHVAP